MRARVFGSIPSSVVIPQIAQRATSSMAVNAPILSISASRRVRGPAYHPRREFLFCEASRSAFKGRADLGLDIGKRRPRGTTSRNLLRSAERRGWAFSPLSTVSLSASAQSQRSARSGRPRRAWTRAKRRQRSGRVRRSVRTRGRQIRAAEDSRAAGIRSEAGQGRNRSARFLSCETHECPGSGGQPRATWSPSPN